MELTFTDIKKVMRGYDCTEVDKRARQFSDDYNSVKAELDDITNNYAILKDKMNTQNLEMYNLERKTTDLEIENKRLKEELEKLQKKKPFALSSETTIEGLEFIS